MRQSASKSSFHLRLVFHLSELRAPLDGIDIVVIPGLWVPFTPEKHSKQCSWLKPLVAATDNDTRVFVFKYDIEHDEEGSLWHQLLALGRLLLDSIRQCRPFQIQRRPLFFVCHGLGGIILKQALYLASYDFPATRNALAGIIFLGTPHLTSPNDERWENWRLLLRIYRKDLPKTILSPQDIEMLAEVCLRFGGLNLHIPVLSVYETVETKVSMGRFRTITKTLVDKSHAALNTEQEEFFGVDGSHNDLHFISQQSALFETLVSFFGNISKNGLIAVNEAYERLEIELDASDTRSQTTRLSKLPLKIIDARQSLDFTTQPKRILLPCYSIGQERNKIFHGQEDVLSRIDEVLLPLIYVDNDTRTEEPLKLDEPAPLKTFVICGIGGIGKTEIAVEYMHSRKTKFDAIFWVNSATTQKLDAGFRDIAIKLGLIGEEEEHEDPVATREIVKGWLSNPVHVISAEPAEEDSNIHWLIVFDNADTPAILYDYWPGGGPGSILVTSRDPLSKEGVLTEHSSIDLPPMSVEGASSLLQKLSLRQTEPDSLQNCIEISKRLGGLPLALVQMAYSIRRKHLSLKEFIEYYERDAKTFQESITPGLTKYQTVASIWNVESLSPPALALLQVISVLDPDFIPEDILTTGAAAVDLLDYPKTKISYFEAREELIKSSLVTRNFELRFLKIHRLVQDVVRQKLTMKALQEVYDTAVSLVSTVWPFLNEENMNKISRLRTLERFFHQLAALKSVLQEKNPEELQPDIKVCALFNEASWYFILQTRGYSLRDAEEFSELSQHVLESSTRDRNEEFFTRLLANSYRYQSIGGTYKDHPLTVPNFKKWISTLVERIENYRDPEDIKTLPIAYNEYGMGLMRAGQRDEALKTWELSCETMNQVTRPGDLPFPYPWVHRGMILAYEGDCDTAESLIIPIIKQRAEKLGIDDTDTHETGPILTCLGNLRRLQGRSDEAYDIHTRAAAVLTATCGEHSPWSATAYYRLAVEHFERGNHKEAAELLDKCIAIYGDIPWSKKEAARSTWKLGRTLQAMGGQENTKRSVVLLEKAMCLRRAIVPDDDRGESELNDHDWDELKP